MNTAKHRAFFRKLCIRSLMKFRTLTSVERRRKERGEVQATTILYSRFMEEGVVYFLCTRNAAVV